MKFRNAVRIVCLTITLACLASCGTDSLAQQFQWKLSAGDQFEVRFVQQSNTSTTVTDRTTEIESETFLEMNWTVKELDEEQNVVIEQSIAAIRLIVGNPAVPSKKISLDTSSEEKPSRPSSSLLKQVIPLVGLTFGVTMTPRGEILDVSIPDNTMKVLQELPSSLQIQTLFSEQGLKELMGASAIVLPKEILKTGESWETRQQVQNGFGEFVRVRRYLFEGVDTQGQREVATFLVETTMDSIKKPTSPESAMLIEFSETGNMKLDPVAGYFFSSDIKSTSKTEMPYREKKIVTTVNNSTQMSIIKK